MHYLLRQRRVVQQPGESLKRPTRSPVSWLHDRQFEVDSRTARPCSFEDRSDNSAADFKTEAGMKNPYSWEIAGLYRLGQPDSSHRCEQQCSGERW